MIEVIRETFYKGQIIYYKTSYINDKLLINMSKVRKIYYRKCC